MHTLDDIDRRLLRILQEDAGMPVAELAGRAGLSAGPCWRRIEKMERSGVILGRAIDVDPRALGYEVRVFLRVVLDKAAGNAFDAFLAAARALPEVIAIETLLGRVDVRMDVVARDLAHYQEIYRDRILALPHIAEIDALMLVSELKNSRAAADMTEIDDVDRAILRALLADGGLSAKEVGTRVGLSQPAAWRRIRRLEEASVIRGRRLILDREKLGFGVVVFLGVKLAAKGRLDLDAFERAVQAIPEVQLVQQVIGVYDYRLRVVARDLSDFERILRRRIATLPGVGQVESNVMLREEKNAPPPI